VQAEISGKTTPKLPLEDSMLRSIYWYTLFVLSLCAHVPLMLWVRFKKRGMAPRDFDWYIHKKVSRWAYRNVRRSGARFHFTGLETIPTDRPVVLVSNHQGSYDIAVFLAFMPFPHAYLAKVETLKLPMLRTWMKYMRCVFIDRKSLRQTAKAIVDGIEVIKAGQSMVLFPEGTRSKSDHMGEFKPGAFKLATKPGVPVVPVTIQGTYRIMEENDGRITPADVYITVHPLIETSGMDTEDVAALPNRVHTIIESALPKVESKCP
jgi:1-acyl-sn-glycerol-3-phosphate acyltransferase